MDEAVHNHRMIDVHACTAECRNVKLVTLYLKRESKKDNQVEEGDSKSGSWNCKKELPLSEERKLRPSLESKSTFRCYSPVLGQKN